MAVERKVATPASVSGAPDLVFETTTVEVSAGAEAGSVYVMYEIPTSARLEGFSALVYDALASSGVTVDVGFERSNQSGVTDPDLLLTGVDVTSASTTALSLIGDPANWGKLVWQVIGLSEDPRTTIKVIVTTVGGTCDTGGTLTTVIAYTI